MPTSINPTFSDQSLKSNTTEVGIVSNLCNALFKVSRFVLNHPTLVITFGLAVQTLLSSASDMNEIQANQTGNSTLLHREAGAGDFAAVQELVKHGFDIHAKDENGMTPMDLACEATDEYSSIINLLESKGARSFCSIFQAKDGEEPPTDDSNTQCLKL